jgi:hypothetical protein
LGERNKQSHLEDDIPANLRSEVLDEHQDVGAKTWRVRWKSSIENQREVKQKQGCVSVDWHLLEDRILVYTCWACQGEKEEGEFRYNQAKS